MNIFTQRDSRGRLYFALYLLALARQPLTWAAISLVIIGIWRGCN